MSLPIVIVNPKSAGGATGAAWPKIASELADHFGAFEPKFTSEAGGAIQLAADVARKGAKLIIACGGDGTISEVANGILLAGTDCELGVLPSGTGGDFRRTIEIPSRTADAAKILRIGITQQIDVGRVTYTRKDGRQENRFFIGVASFGMSAEVISRVKDSPGWVTKTPARNLSARITYGVAMLKTAASQDATRVVVQLDDEPAQRMTITNLCVANARYFGGGMKIAPNAKLNDGKFDVVTIGDLGTAKILRNAPRLYSGTHLNMDEVRHALATKVFAQPFDSAKQVALEIDGELLGSLPATFQIVKSALRVRCP